MVNRITPKLFQEYGVTYYYGDENTTTYDEQDTGFRYKIMHNGKEISRGIIVINGPLEVTDGQFYKLLFWWNMIGEHKYLPC